MSEAKYKRVLLKLSGEALAGDQKTGVNPEVVGSICDKIKEVVEMGVQVAIVVGGGNFWRGRQGLQMERTTADYMGMLATEMNGLALQDALEARGIHSRVQTAIEMREIAEPFIQRKAEKHLNRGRVVIFACGTGHPYFTTDTAAVLRATEIKADIILLGKATIGKQYLSVRNNLCGKSETRVIHIIKENTYLDELGKTFIELVDGPSLSSDTLYV